MRGNVGKGNFYLVFYHVFTVAYFGHGGKIECMHSDVRVLWDFFDRGWENCARVRVKCSIGKKLIPYRKTD